MVFFKQFAQLTRREPPRVDQTPGNLAPGRPSGSGRAVTGKSQKSRFVLYLLYRVFRLFFWPSSGVFSVVFGLLSDVFLSFFGLSLGVFSWHLAWDIGLKNFSPRVS